MTKPRRERRGFTHLHGVASVQLLTPLRIMKLS